MYRKILSLGQVEKPEPMGLRAMLDAQEKREKAQSFLANRQSQVRRLSMR